MVRVLVDARVALSQPLDMRIPDGVLSPRTCVVAPAAMLPVWAVAGRSVRQSLRACQIPLLALRSAFYFTVMMFSIPGLGGRTAHPVARTLLAIMLCPFAACVGDCVALAIQALSFGEGGVLAYGANWFTMAFVLPFVGNTVYQLLCGPQRNEIASERAVCRCRSLCRIERSGGAGRGLAGDSASLIP